MCVVRQQDGLPQTIASDSSYYGSLGQSIVVHRLADEAYDLGPLIGRLRISLTFVCTDQVGRFA